jgi:hypothetical protein
MSPRKRTLAGRTRFHNGEGLCSSQFPSHAHDARVTVNHPRGSGRLDLGRIELPSQFGLMLPA